MSSFIKLDVGYEDSVLEDAKIVHEGLVKLEKYVEENFIRRRLVLNDVTLALPEDLSRYFSLHKYKGDSCYYVSCGVLVKSPRLFKEYEELREASSDNIIYADRGMVSVHKYIKWLASFKEGVLKLCMKYIGVYCD